MKNFKANIINIYGDKGRKWLDNLHQTISDISIDWSLSDLTPVPNLTYNYVLAGFHNDTPIILKLSLDIGGLEQESMALNAFSNFGSVKVLKKKEGVLLLERAVPGLSLRSYFPKREFESINIASALMQKLHQAKIPHDNFPHIKDGLSIFDKGWNIPSHLLQKAKQLRNQLCDTTLHDVLLHGDLHHDNILQNGDTWVAIDPKGVIGEPAYETASFIFNHIPELLGAEDARDRITTRIIKFGTALNVDPKRILNWSFVRSVQSWIWNLEDRLDTTYSKKCTEILDAILNLLNNLKAEL